MAQQKLEQDVCQLILAPSCGPVLHHDRVDNGPLTVTVMGPLEPRLVLLQKAELLTLPRPSPLKAVLKNN